MRSYTFAALLFPALAVCRLFKDDAYLQDSAGASSIVQASPASVPTSGSPAATGVSIGEILELRQAPGLTPANAAPPVDPGLVPQSAPENPAVPAGNLAPAVAPVSVDSSSSSPSSPSSPSSIASPSSSSLGVDVSAAATVPATSTVVAPPANQIAPAVPPAAVPVNPAAPALTTAAAPLAAPDVNDFVTVQWVETWIGGTSQTWVPKTISFHFKDMTAPLLPGKGEIGMGTLTGEPGQTKTVMLGAAPTEAAGWRGVAAAVGVGVVGMMVVVRGRGGFRAKSENGTVFGSPQHACEILGDRGKPDHTTTSQRKIMKRGSTLIKNSPDVQMDEAQRARQIQEYKGWSDTPGYAQKCGAISSRLVVSGQRRSVRFDR
ncbi:uncharacterized protein K460DRAFT_352302 [Cucurbitaria berberidis CBS 394.84]|uniref:Uncharacterized protein n=1 Tax=Cucurbitaria berberidis CBS 394.84 TaxID=1168544 RepID=A0A9P4GKW8_9PLEO|nr:uncharacterized protein K460DRAFT_352302 [Cucurbitaria berberidis CBS 394.84]KAF1847122.1 hypothetical protein K460DRAFT_352302 [Cucurbitaria berberidis CBS 394.84]